jgi:hypothetical protein
VSIPIEKLALPSSEELSQKFSVEHLPDSKSDDISKALGDNEDSGLFMQLSRVVIEP